jgi:flagellar hook-length control protein FliK
MPQQTSSTLVAQQIAGAFVRSDGGRTEISLNPEELGRVRFAMVASDTGMTFVISAERAETADLMRRNLEDLAREFRELGYQNLTFSFEDHPQDGNEAENDRNATFVPMPDDLTSLLEQSMARRPMQGTLDLKL